MNKIESFIAKWLVISIVACYVYFYNVQNLNKEAFTVIIIGSLIMTAIYETIFSLIIKYRK